MAKSTTATIHATRVAIAVGKALKEKREKHKLTQDQLARAAHVSQTTISRIENATAIPELDVAVRLSQVLKGLNLWKEALWA